MFESCGQTFDLYMYSDDLDMIETEFVTVEFSPGEEGEWIQASGNKPEGVTDTDWAEWNTLLDEGALVDGFWNPDMVTVTLEETGEDAQYAMSVNLPCSGRYKVTPASDRYRFVPVLEEQEDYITVYPSVKNFWASKSYVTGDGKYSPIGLKINGVAMNNNSSEVDVESPDIPTLDDVWKMDYPFLEGKVFLHGNLDKSVVRMQGVYLAEMWTRADETEASAMATRRKADASDPEGHAKSAVIDLTNLGTEDGTDPYKSYEVSVVLRKNGATTPLETNGKSTEYFNVRANKEVEIPTGIHVVGDADLNADIEVYTVSGYLVGRSLENLRPGIYIIRQGARSSKLYVK